MNLPEINLSRPRFSPRFFIYLLFGLVILVLIVEGGYYFWVQQRTENQRTKNPVIVQEEGVFTYVNTPEGENWIIKKMIFGTIKKIEGNLLTIKTDNNKTVQVLFTGENLLVVDSASAPETARFREDSKIEDLFIGDEVRIADISPGDKGQITAKFLAVVRGASQ